MQARKHILTDSKSQPMHIKRKLAATLTKRLFRGKAIILLGARQVGKSTLMNHIISQLDLPVLSLNCDDPEVRTMLSRINSVNLRMLVGQNRIIAIDEAQRIDEIGLVLKRIVDEYPSVQVMASGSSSLQLRSSVNEPLTGRKYEYEMYPVSTGELFDTLGFMTTAQLL